MKSAFSMLWHRRWKPYIVQGYTYVNVGVRYKLQLRYTYVIVIPYNVGLFQRSVTSFQHPPKVATLKTGLKPIFNSYIFNLEIRAVFQTCLKLV